MPPRKSRSRKGRGGEVKNGAHLRSMASRLLLHHQICRYMTRAFFDTVILQWGQEFFRRLASNVATAQKRGVFQEDNTIIIEVAGNCTGKHDEQLRNGKKYTKIAAEKKADR
eukprot:876148-Pyramimonas_sp.AAC.1